MEFGSPEDAMAFLAARQMAVPTTASKPRANKPEASFMADVLIVSKRPVRELTAAASGQKGMSQTYEGLIVAFGSSVLSDSMVRVIQTSNNIPMGITVKARVGKKQKKGSVEKTNYENADIWVAYQVQLNVSRWGGGDAEEFAANSLHVGNVYSLLLSAVLGDPREGETIRRLTFDVTVPKGETDSSPMVPFTVSPKSAEDAVLDLIKLCPSVADFVPVVDGQPKRVISVLNKHIHVRDMEGNKAEVMNKASLAIPTEGHPFFCVTSNSLTRRAEAPEKWDASTFAYRSFPDGIPPALYCPPGTGSVGDCVRGVTVAFVDPNTMMDPDSRAISAALDATVVPTEPNGTRVAIDFKKTLVALSKKPEKNLDDLFGPGLVFQPSVMAEPWSVQRHRPETFSVIRSPDESNPATQIYQLPVDTLDHYHIVSPSDKEAVKKCRNLNDKKTAPFIYCIRKDLVHEEPLVVPAPAPASSAEVPVALAEESSPGKKRKRDDLFGDDDEEEIKPDPEQPKKKKHKGNQ